MDAVTIMIAVAGAVVSVISLTVSIAAFRRDRASLHVRYTRDMRLIGTERLHDNLKALLENVPKELEAVAGAQLDKMKSDMIRYDPSKRWTYITIVNDGRRPVKFEKAGLLIESEGPLTALEGKVTLLPEGESTEIPVDEEMLKRYEAEAGKRVYAAFALDILGREYFSPLPFTKRVLRFFGLSPFSSHRASHSVSTAETTGLDQQP